MARTFWLIGIEGPARRVMLPIRGPLLIGRGSYNHIVLQDAGISRQHARIALEPDGCFVYDLGSTNGTFVNGARIERHVLSLHDDVRFGSLLFRITAPEVEEASADEPELERPTLRDLAGALRSPQSSGPPPSSGPSVRDVLRDSAQMPVVDLGQLEDAYGRLGTLYSFLQAVSRATDRDKLLELIGERTREVYSAANGVGVYLRDSGSDAFRLAHYVGDAKVEPSLALPEDIGGAVLGSPKGVLAPARPGRGRGRAAATGMYAPMIDNNETVGVIHVVADPREGGFSREDLDLLAGMAAPAAVMLRNATNQQELRQRERLKHDLELAAQIQKSFLPREVVSVEGVELFAEYRAAYSVGGDFYDVFFVAPDRLGVFIGDISGKGVAGALLMARISSEMRVAALTHVEPVAVLTAMNKTLITRNQPELFFTAIYLTLNVKTGQVILANAGHPSPYCKQASGSLLEICEGVAGPVGIVEDPQFQATVVRLEHGDTLVLYTDGVVEASSSSGVLYGADRLEKVLAEGDMNPSGIAERILASVGSHLAEVPANDDLTLFICQRNIGHPASLQPRRRSGGHNLTIPTPPSLPDLKPMAPPTSRPDSPGRNR